MSRFITHFKGKRIEKWDSIKDGGYVLRLEDGRTLVKISLDVAIRLARPDLRFRIEDRDDSLHLLYEKQTKEVVVSEGNEIERLCEKLVKLDRAVAQHGGRYAEPILVKQRIEGECYSSTYMPIQDRDVAIPGEKLIPAGVHVRVGGHLEVLFRPHGDDYPYAFMGFSPGHVDEAFPEVYATLQGALIEERYLGDFLFATRKKLEGKPRLIELAQDYLKNSRLVVAELTAEQRESDANSFYGKADDYGMF